MHDVRINLNDKEVGMPFFYDSHCHMMNLSHPNLSAIIKRIYFEAIRPLLVKYLKLIILIPLGLWLLIKLLFL